MQPFTNALFEYTLQDDKSYLLLEEISPEINSPVICIHIEHGQSRYWQSIVIIPLLYLPIPSLSFKPGGRHFNCPNSFALRIFNPLDWFMWRENSAEPYTYYLLSLFYWLRQRQTYNLSNHHTNKTDFLEMCRHECLYVRKRSVMRLSYHKYHPCLIT